MNQMTNAFRRSTPTESDEVFSPARPDASTAPIPDIEPHRLSARMRPQSNDPFSPVKRLGQELREARERKGKQLDDVWREIKIRPIHLTAIEEGRFEDLPSRSFTIGFVSRYARYLGLEVERLDAAIGHHSGAFNHRTDIVPILAAQRAVRRTDSAGVLLIALTILFYGIALYTVVYVAGRLPW